MRPSRARRLDVITTGLVLFVLGLLFALGAFAFAAWNMYSGVTSDDRSITGMFAGHVSAMVAMALGGAASTIGIVLLIIGLVLKFAGA